MWYVVFVKFKKIVNLEFLNAKMNNNILQSSYLQRRSILMDRIKDGLIFFPGNRESPMNYADNTYHFRQDSSFLYYIGIDRPSYRDWETDRKSTRLNSSH